MKKYLFVISFILGSLLLSAQDMDKIIQKHLEASGQEKLNKVECIISTGAINMPSMGMEMKYTITRSRPENLKLESDFNGSTMIQSYNGSEGWIYAPGLGIPEPKAMGPTELESARSQATMDFPLYKYSERGENAEYIGEENFNEKPSYHIRLTSAAGVVVDYFIDKGSYLMNGYTASQSINGQDLNIQTSLSDYKKIKGTMHPQTTTVKMNGQVMSIMKVENIKYTSKADPAQFGKPEVE